MPFLWGFWRGMCTKEEKCPSAMNYCSKFINNIFTRTYNLKRKVSYSNMNYILSPPHSNILCSSDTFFTRWTGRFVMGAGLWLRSEFYLQSWINVISLSLSCTDLSAGKSPSNSQLRKCHCKMIYRVKWSAVPSSIELQMMWSMIDLLGGK